MVAGVLVELVGTRTGIDLLGVYGHVRVAEEMERLGEVLVVIAEDIRGNGARKVSHALVDIARHLPAYLADRGKRDIARGDRVGKILDVLEHLALHARVLGGKDVLDVLAVYPRLPRGHILDIENDRLSACLAEAYQGVCDDVARPGKRADLLDRLVVDVHEKDIAPFPDLGLDREKGIVHPELGLHARIGERKREEKEKREDGDAVFKPILEENANIRLFFHGIHAPFFCR